MSDEQLHPTPDEIRAVAFGWTTVAQVGGVRAHAAGCAMCGSLFNADEQVRELLAGTSVYEPAPDEDLVAEVFRRIVRSRTERPRRSPRRLALAVTAVLCFAFGATILITPGTLDAAEQWLRSIVVRELPAANQLGAPPATRVPTKPGGPVRTTTLEEATQVATFPVRPPQWVPEGFALAEARMFQPEPSAPPSQVFLTYRSREAQQPLVLTYQAPTSSIETIAAPGATHELVVAGHRAVYIDTAAEGLRPVEPTGDAPELGRLIVERPDLVLTAAGDRRDGLGPDMLAVVVSSVP